MRVALCFACNEAYIPLCKGLVLSLTEPLRRAPASLRISAHFIDIGCTPAAHAWLEAHDVAIHSFDRARFLPGIRPEQAPSYADAQLCRPFLPEIVPGYDMYLWVDCDFWIQDRDALPEVIMAARTFAGKAIICPELHYGYMAYRNEKYGTVARRRWYEAFYDAAEAKELSWHPTLNSGFFALAAKSPLWRAWGEEIARLYAMDMGSNTSMLHYAEQLALNYLLYSHQAFVPLDPLFNYACGGASVLRTKLGVVVGCPPFTPVKGVHLLAFSHYGRMFLEKGLLYDRGNYLAEEERSALSALIRET